MEITDTSIMGTNSFFAHIIMQIMIITKALYSLPAAPLAT